jgi:hypothetical protein
MLQPTIYIPSQLTRVLAALEPAPEAGSRQEQYCIGHIGLALPFKNL